MCLHFASNKSTQYSSDQDKLPCTTSKPATVEASIKFEQEPHPLNLFFFSFLSFIWNFSQSFPVFFVLDSCGQKCHQAPTAWDGRALKLSVRGRSSVNLTLGDTLWTSKRVLRVTSTLSKRVTSSHPPKSFPVLDIAGDNSNFVISVPHLPVQYPSRLFPKRQET